MLKTSNMEMKTIAQQLNIKKFPFIIKDDNGNQIYYEDSDNRWYKSEYDSNGNQIYYENSEGYWEKHEFDSDGNEIYLEDSEGYWCRCKYDSSGKQIYFQDLNGIESTIQNSNGITQNKRYKPCEPNVVEIDGIKYKLTKL